MTISAKINRSSAYVMISFNIFLFFRKFLITVKLEIARKDEVKNKNCEKKLIKINYSQYITNLKQIEKLIFANLFN